MAVESRILALDPGSKKVGLALSDPMKIIGQPYATWILTNDFWGNLQILVREKNISMIIVGIPHGLRGDSDQTRWARDFVLRLKSEISVPVISRSEIFTTKIARQKMADLPKKHRRREDDSLAAAVLLQDYLDQENKSI